MGQRLGIHRRGGGVAVRNIPTHAPPAVYKCESPWCAKHVPARMLYWSDTRWLCRDSTPEGAPLGITLEQYLLSLQQHVAGGAVWHPISTLTPNPASPYTFCRIAWGSAEKRSEAEGMRFKSDWFAASIFHLGGRRGERHYGFREHKVTPTHWQPNIERPCVDPPAGDARAEGGEC